MLKSIGQIKSALNRFKLDLDNLSESYDRRMRNASNSTTNKDIADLKNFKKKEQDKKQKSKGQIVAITSNLWDTVILITHGIQKGVKSTEPITDFSNICTKDYKVKNVFEINHP